MTDTKTEPLPGISSQAALDLVTTMMAVPGKSREEGRVAEFIRRRLAEAGVRADAIVTDKAHKRSPGGGETGNLIVKLPGTIRGPRRLLMAHIDTVPLCVGSRPVRRGPLIGSRDAHTALGADNRAGASVVLNSILEIQRQNLPYPPLTLFWPIQEEIGLVGARYASLAKLGRPALCFNWDGGPPDVAIIGATGDYNMEIEVKGVASHAGAHPERGVSAITICGLAMAELEREGWHGLIIKGSKTGTSNIGYVHAGEATNVVTPVLSLRAEARSHDPQFRKKIVEAYRKAFQKAALQVKNDSGQHGRIQFDADLKYESFKLSEDEACVMAASRAIEMIGHQPVLKISNGGLDANWMTARGLPTVTLGCGQQNVHTVNETLHVDNYLDACRIGLLLATGRS